VPYAVRDPHARKDHPRKGAPDEWGKPFPNGLFRDDNSLIKGIPRSLRINGVNPRFNDARIGRGFVAAHVFPRLVGSRRKLSVRDPLTYSFVPNLVWLPSELAKLTDHDFFRSAMFKLSAARCMKPHRLPRISAR
jgi:hypothetical protein